MMDNMTHTLFNVAAAVGSVEEIPNELLLNQANDGQPQNQAPLDEDIDIDDMEDKEGMF